MKRFNLLLLFEFIISINSGILISKMSWIGRISINLFKNEYKILKIWWKTTLSIFAILFLLAIIQLIINRFCKLNISRIIFILFLFLGIIGLGYTYHDFSTVYKHKLMKERFHLGVYLFWIGWLSSNLYFLVTPYNKTNKTEKEK